MSRFTRKEYPKYRGTFKGETVYVKNRVETGEFRWIPMKDPKTGEVHLAKTKVYTDEHSATWVWDGRRWQRDLRVVECGGMTPAARPDPRSTGVRGTRWRSGWTAGGKG